MENMFSQWRKCGCLTSAVEIPKRVSLCDDIVHVLFHENYLVFLCTLWHALTALVVVDAREEEPVHSMSWSRREKVGVPLSANEMVGIQGVVDFGDAKYAFIFIWNAWFCAH
jgi:hypothetical protein